MIETGSTVDFDRDFTNRARDLLGERGLRMTMILAQSLNGVIGDQGKLLWRIPEDLKMFKATTMDGTLVMGRKTYDSIIASFGRPLPGRTTIVVSSQMLKALPDGVLLAHTPLSAMEMAPADKTIHIVGGARIYNTYLHAADEIYVTLVKELYAGDAAFDVFPLLTPDLWRVAEVRELTPGATLFRIERRAS
ncbi:MAG: dihydrofolate reductase [Leptospirales bacterium]|jgi:dihydrofolate reductase